jgi:hypothetical protein
MATFNFTVITSYEPEFGGYLISINPSTSSGDPQDAVRGDYFRFTHSTSGHSNSVNIAYSSTHFEGTLSNNLSSGQSVSRRVKSSSPYSSGSVVCAISNKNARTYYRILSAVDDTPNAFTIPNITYANPGALYTSNYVTIRDINVDVQASISGGGCKFRISETGSFTTANKTVSNNQRVTLQMYSAGGYSQAVSATITVGNTSSTWTITNQVDPGSGERIPFPITSGRIGLGDLRDFYGGTGAIKLGNYIRGGVYVPNISPENDSIPTSKSNMKISDYWGSATSLFFSTSPQSEIFRKDTLNGGGTYALATSKSIDFNLGYGDGMNDAVELRFTLIDIDSSDGNGQDSDVDVTVTNGSLNTWSGSHFSVRSEVTVQGNTEAFYEITLKVEARHPNHTGLVVSRTIQHKFQFYGP